MRNGAPEARSNSARDVPMRALRLVALLGLFGFAQTSIAQNPRTAAVSRRTLERDLGGAKGGLRVVRASGISDLARTPDSVKIAPGEFVFRKMADTASRVERKTPTATKDTLALVPSIRGIDKAATFAMPYRWLTIDSSGVQRILAPFFVLVGGGLSYDVQTRMYRGTALVGVEDTLHLSETSVTLPRPIKLQITTTSGGTVTPAQLAIGHTSLDYDSVRIESTDSTNIRIRTGADPAGILIRIPVRSLAVGMVPQQPSLQAFGLGTTNISVSLPRGIGRADTAVVTFSATKAPVRPSSVRLSGGDAATLNLRSGLPGTDSIRAFLDGVQVGETLVEFNAPWTFLGATIFGLLLGGSARFVSAKRRKKARALGWDILKGAPFGFIAAAASAIGLDLLQLKVDDPGTVIACALTAAIGAWVGTKVLDRPSVVPVPAKSS
jgi:hypothetical protein